jgi:ABC-type phosphate/phosphonate transport system substrate-binding protein
LRRGDPVPSQALPAVGCVGDTSQAAQVRTVGIVPQLPPAEVFSRWRPVLQRLGQKAGLCFELVVPVSIPRFAHDLQQGRYD